MTLPAALWPPTPHFPPLWQSPPKYWFGEIVRHKPSRENCEVVGVQWMKTDDPACLDGWYYTVRLLNTNSPHFRTCRIGGNWAEEVGHEKDLARVRK